MKHSPLGGPRCARRTVGTDRSSHVPDLSVLERQALQRLAGIGSLTPPPLLLVEIISPDSRRRDLTGKADALLAELQADNVEQPHPS